MKTGVPPLALDSATAVRMSKQRRRDTAPEVLLRSELHRRGLRFRVGLKVPGAPRRSIDIAFPRRRVAVFVDGCFWHRCPVHATAPSSNAAWWADKLGRNVARDAETNALLAGAGWTVVRIWEHEEPETAARRVADAVGVATSRT